MKYLVLLALFFTPFIAKSAAEIGYGTIHAIKHYNLSSTKAIKIYFKNDVSNYNGACRSQNFIHGYLPITSQNEKEVDRVLSIAMAAQLSGKKIRLYSEASTCQISLISISDTNF
jgi:hypothetical protein